jgi:hypothetical protein
MLSSGTGEYRQNKHQIISVCLLRCPVAESSWTRPTTSKRGRQTLPRLLLPLIQATGGVCLVRPYKTVWESSIRLCDSWEEIVSDVPLGFEIQNLKTTFFSLCLLLLQEVSVQIASLAVRQQAKL